MIWLIGHFLAICIGLSLGLIGGGGSVLAVPILIYVMGLSSKMAIATSLVIVGTVSLIGVVPHWMQGNVNFRTVFIFTPLAMLGAYLGAIITKLPLITDTFQLICFGIVMALASLLMIRKSGTKILPGKYHNVNESNELNSINQHQRQTSGFLIPLLGLGVGILTGFVGVGGGFMIIPALVLLGGLPMKEAIGTSLLIITANSTTGFLGYLNQVNVDWNLIITFTLAASAGTLTGSYLTKFIDAKDLQKGFGYFVLAVAIFVLVRR